MDVNGPRAGPTDISLGTNDLFANSRDGITPGLTKIGQTGRVQH